MNNSLDNKRKFYLIFHGRFPSEKAAALFTAKNAESFQDNGMSVTVLVPRRLGRIHLSPKEFFGLHSSINTVYLPVVDLFPVPGLRKIAFLLSYFSFSFSIFIYVFFKATQKTIMYSNEALPLFLLSFVFPHIYYEMHDYPARTAFYGKFLRRVRGIISTNQWKSSNVVRDFVIDSSKVLYEPNAVDLVAFKSETPKAKDGYTVGYVGALKTMNMEKGIDILLEAVSRLKDVQLLIVGGTKKEIDEYVQKSRELTIENRVTFVGFIPHAEVARYLAQMDVLVAPFPNNNHYNLYMSPMKIFEYMAAQKPIIATRLRSIEEIVGEEGALLIEPGDPTALVEAIMKVRNNQVLRDTLVSSAYAKVLNHSWDARAVRIMDFIKK